MEGKLININIETGIAKLIDTASRALGFEAIAIKKEARARAYEMVITAEAEEEANLIKLESMNRIEAASYIKEFKKFSNTQNILRRAEKFFAPNEKISEDPVNPDWASQFFGMAEDISEEYMQNLWAKILAGEVKQPKSFSIRTLNILRSITQEEAELLVRYSQFYVPGSGLYIDVDSFPEQTMEEVYTLEELGLINAQQHLIKYPLPEEGDEPLSIPFTDSILISRVNKTANRDATLDLFRLTKAGQEILSLIEVDTHEQLPYVMGKMLAKSFQFTMCLHKLNYMDGQTANFVLEPLEIFEPDDPIN